MTEETWRAQAAALFGPDPMQWRFVCPVCGFIQSVQDYKDAGAPNGAVGFSCVGRFREGSRKAFGGCGDGPCNYSGGGLFQVNPVDVDGRKVFAFALISQAEMDAMKERGT